MHQYQIQGNSCFKARYIDTCHRGEQIPRNALAAAQLPDPQHAAEDAGDAVANNGIAMI